MSEGTGRTKQISKSTEQCLGGEAVKDRVFARALFHDCSMRVARDVGAVGSKWWAGRCGARSEDEGRVAAGLWVSDGAGGIAEDIEEFAWCAGKCDWVKHGRG